MTITLKPRLKISPHFSLLLDQNHTVQFTSHQGTMNDLLEVVDYKGRGSNIIISHPLGSMNVSVNVVQQSIKSSVRDLLQVVDWWNISKAMPAEFLKMI